MASEQAQLGRLTVRRSSADSSEPTKSRPLRRREGGAAGVGALQVFVDELSASELAAVTGGGAVGDAAAEGDGGPADAARLAAEVERLTAELERCGEVWRDEAERLSAALELARSTSGSSWREDQSAEIERLAAELATERTARVEAEARAASVAQLLTQVAYMHVCEGLNRPCGHKRALAAASPCPGHTSFSGPYPNSYPPPPWPSPTPSHPHPHLRPRVHPRARPNPALPRRSLSYRRSRSMARLRPSRSRSQPFPAGPRPSGCRTTAPSQTAPFRARVV